mmetsp:Transcript_92847/g.155916  ORF Transcript_92847/g.155916 Transcript_92847/m.155916 type:complete len:88 (+) Transcript_92847:200-463(+)
MCPATLDNLRRPFHECWSVASDTQCPGSIRRMSQVCYSADRTNVRFCGKMLTREIELERWLNQTGVAQEGLGDTKAALTFKHVFDKC